MSAKGPQIDLQRICLHYADTLLFSHLCATLPAGKTSCILGPSGCGKSTLLRLLAGDPQLSFSGRISTSPAQTAWMGQKDLLLPWKTLLENLLLGCLLRGEKQEANKVRALELLHKGGLYKYRNAFPDALSGGMRQRGALLRTLMENRSILLMDEPFSALDALTRNRLQDLTASLTTDCTVVLVTHDPLEALRLGHRILLLGGKPTRIVTDLDLSLLGAPPRPISGAVLDTYEQLMAQIFSKDLS